MKTSYHRVNRLIKDIKKRWIFRTLKQGIAITILTFIFFAVIYILLSYRFGTSPLFQSIGIAVASIVLLVEIVQFIVRPLCQRLSNQKIALFIEEKVPELEDRINSAVEIGGLSPQRAKNILIDKLIDDATRKVRTVQISTVIDRKKERILSYSAYGLLLLFLLFIYTFRDDISTVTSKMEFNFKPPAEPKQEFIHIIPGNIQIEKGESQQIMAELKKASYDDVLLHFKIGDDIWRKEIMQKGLDKPLYMYQFFSIQEPVNYYVELNEIRSPEFTISIYEFPKVTQIDLKYTYPLYTGLPDRIEENTGNIRGLKGSEVTLTIETTGTAVTGELIVNDSQRIPLRPLNNGIFQGNLTLQDYGIYYVKLTDKEDKNNKFPEEYQITPVDDELPIITITEPQRDVRVNAVEEVLLAASATDDFGISRVQLKYSINGNEEKPVDLIDNDLRETTKVSGSHIFYLEDFILEPGDIISYYVEAEDNFHKDNPAVTDMYFIEVVPFDAKYTQVNNQQDGGAQQGSQQGGSQMVLNQQMIIAATWKLYRLRNEKTPEDFEESREALVQAQTNLRDNIDNRVNSTAFSMEMVTDEENKEIADLLRSAVKEMNSAVEMLTDSELLEALKPEQRALNYLLKADAKNKEKRVQRSRQQASQAGGSQSQRSPSEERMTELMDLELDISKDKYEIQQQQSERQQNEEVNDALRKIEELAKRQQLLANQSRNNLQEEDDRRFLDRLKRDQEELRQEAENLSNTMRQMSSNNQQITRQLQERMQRIAETMRQAEQEMKNGNIQQSMSRQRQALNELNKLQQDMRMSLTDNAREILDNFTENFEQFKEQERQLAQDIRENYDETQKNRGKVPDETNLKRLAENRENMIDNLKNLENQASAIEEQTLQENPRTSTDMRNIQNTIKREDLERKMEESKIFLQNGWLTYARIIEDDIQSSIEIMENQIRELEGGLPVTEEERLSRSLEDTREMLRQFKEVMAQTQQNQQDSERASAQQQGARSMQERDSQQNANSRGQQQQSQGREQMQEQQQGGRGGGDRDRNNIARMQRLHEQFQQMIDRMEREYMDDTGMRHTLEGARHTAAPRITGELLDEAAKEHFKKSIFEPLSQLEMHLLERLDAIELEKKLYGMRKAEVPPEYKRLVDKYFESISKKNE